MYQPKKYINNSPEFIHSFIQQYPFATVVLKGECLLATHIPVLIDGNKENYRLFAHIANHNQMHRFLKNGEEMLVIFQGPDSYISSSWYSFPEIPTWDYEAVHVNGKITLQSDYELQDSLERLMGYFERDSENPVTYKTIPKEIWNDNFSGITGFWIEPFQALGIEKLHQGFEYREIQNINDKLQKGCPKNIQLASLLKKKHNLE
ncbi:FMN-binding negative transcriptional regulator [Aequorivita sp. H23M31]|uniref:FMN-binding negative transcriptional regulator n=1 Tax=Aequorivita ciconiae TaxID=2494375 RepID=A0A410G1H2_9FLAO|nr:FMN-binding negative transcriptional regulator [Aequorivita sp. H23M31]QAA81090.1 FMN-binding negative transcriptional regulator [Aequorivita sp. H23M31]